MDLASLSLKIAAASDVVDELENTATRHFVKAIKIWNEWDKEDKDFPPFNN